jgi:hypothetical protein
MNLSLRVSSFPLIIGRVGSLITPVWAPADPAGKPSGVQQCEHVPTITCIASKKTLIVSLV